MTAREAMRILESSSEPVSLHVLRQVSPVHSAGSSPTPTSQSAMSPLSDHSYHSNQRSHSDTIAHPSFILDDSMSYTPGGNKTSRSLCSQTDSIDSSVPSSRKNRERQHGFKEVFKVLFRHRPSHDSQLDIDERGGSSYISNSNLGMQENVIVEFDPVSNRKDERNKSKQRKREVEIESNSGTWPKSSHQMRPSFLNANNTVIIRPQPKERPILRPDSYIEPPFYDRLEKFDSPGRHHSQNSDPSIKYGQTVHDEPRTLFASPPSKSPVFQPLVYNGSHQHYTRHTDRDKGYMYNPIHNSHPPPQKVFPPTREIDFNNLNKNPPGHHGRSNQNRNPDKRPGNINRPISLDVSNTEFQHDSLLDNRNPSPRSNGLHLGNSQHPFRFAFLI